jgi:hypothetical protein
MRSTPAPCKPDLFAKAATLRDAQHRGYRKTALFTANSRAFALAFLPFGNFLL